VISVIGVVLLLASEPSTLVLWHVYESGGGNMRYERKVVPDSAHSGLQECLKEVRIQASSHVETYKNLANVKGIERSTISGGNERVRTALKTGGNLSLTFMCLPHPVKPEYRESAGRVGRGSYLPGEVDISRNLGIVNVQSCQNVPLDAAAGRIRMTRWT
jgi:hypothetical protein